MAYEVDWTKSMKQTYEFYKVDPFTWKDIQRLTSIKSCSISRDMSTDTLETASFDTTGSFSECYIRVYLSVDQNGGKQRVCLGTFMIQTPSINYDGKIKEISVDAYSPLLELDNLYLPLGFTLLKDESIMAKAYEITTNYLRTPVLAKPADLSKTLVSNFTSEPEESILKYNIALMKQADYQYLLDETSRALFAPILPLSSLQPRWTYSDDNSSILQAEVTDNFDLYGVPNVVEVYYSTEDGEQFYSRVVNDDPESEASTVKRGREVHYREINPDISGTPTQQYIEDYAKNLLIKLSEVEHTITYTHGYCPVRIGDCIRLNYKRAGLNNVVAKVIKQEISCVSGCMVNETAVYTTNLWKGR